MAEVAAVVDGQPVCDLEAEVAEVAAVGGEDFDFVTFKDVK